MQENPWLRGKKVITLRAGPGRGRRTTRNGGVSFEACPGHALLPAGPVFKFRDGTMHFHPHLSRLALWLVVAVCTAPMLARAQNCTAPNADGDYILGEAGTDASAMHWPTGLVWKRCVEGETFGGGHCAGGAQSEIWVEWAQTQQKLPLTFSGQEDGGLDSAFSQNLLQSGAWRMAYKSEWQAIAENCNAYPAINTTVFPDIPNGYGWSASPDALDSTLAWYQDMGSAYFMSSNRLGNYYTRLVRGGQPFASLTSPAAQNAAAGTQAAFSPVTLARSTGAGADAAWGGARISGDGSPEFQVNGGGWVTQAIVQSGDQITVRLTAPVAGSYTATLALRSPQTTGTSANAANGGDEVTAMVETTASFVLRTIQQPTVLTLPEGPQQGQPLTVAPQPDNGWQLTQASTQTVASLGAPALPPGVTLPYGVVRLRLDDGNPGSSTTVVLTYPQALPPEARYYKYGKTSDNATPHWYIFPGAQINGSTITLTLSDGGMGDDDLLQNSAIEDPGGMGMGGDVAAIPTLGQWALVLLAGALALLSLGVLRERGAVRG